MSQTVTKASVKPIEVVTVNERVVSCEGSGGRLGHPKVFLRMQGHLGGPATQVKCPYCSRLFLLSGDAADEGH
jgi:uncharacterized Zn-finger protein